jgi:radical S-adenosyl methionine domain-containing protein 2
MTYQNENGSITIPAINFFITPYCNMKCRFCFGKFKKSQYPLAKRREIQFKVIKACADAGIEKITFVGGEPLLCKWLNDAIGFAHDLGMCTCVVTNGSLVTKQWIQSVSNVLEWIGISIDSMMPETNIISGRAVNGLPISEDHYRQMIGWIHRAGIRLKINTTVNSWNCNEDMVEFLRWANPDRLKMFQALTIDDINSSNAETFSISEQNFFNYVDRHRSGGIHLIAETATEMKGSYLMVSPDGSFFENMHGEYRFSSPIHDVGYYAALSEIRVSSAKFHIRGGVYNWS